MVLLALMEETVLCFPAAQQGKPEGQSAESCPVLHAQICPVWDLDSHIGGDLTGGRQSVIHSTQ